MADVSEKRVKVLESAARTGSETSIPVLLPHDAVNIGVAVETTAFTSGTFSAKIQHSLSGDQWEDVPGAATGNINSVGLETAYATGPCLPLVRVVLTGATTPSATDEVYIVYG